VILSESLAKYYFKNDDPIGGRIRLKQVILSQILRPGSTNRDGQWSDPFEVVGVAADSRADGIDQAPMHTLYQPDTQAGSQVTLLVRTMGPTEKLAPHLIEAIRALDPNRRDPAAFEESYRFSASLPD
jgi:hypothetical protein